MENVVLHSMALEFGRALPLNSFAFEFSTQHVQRELPSGDGVFDMGRAGVTCNSLKVYPFAMGNPGDQFAMRVYAWHGIRSAQQNGLWHRTSLNDSICMLGVQRGFDGGVLNESEYFCGDAMGNISFLYVPVFGAQLIQFEFAYLNHENRVAMNALWSRAS